MTFIENYSDAFRYGDDEYPVAAKEHQCVACGRTILKGEHYNRARFFAKGSRDQGTWKACRHCTALIDLATYSFADSTQTYTDALRFHAWALSPDSVSPKEKQLKTLVLNKWQDVEGNLVDVPRFPKSPYKQDWEEDLARHNLTIEEFCGNRVV